MTPSSKGAGRIGDTSRPAPQAPKGVYPQDDPKVLVDVQHLTAMRRTISKMVERCAYVVRETEDRLYPLIVHTDGCPAIENDDLRCLSSCPGYELRLTLKTIVVTLLDLIDRATIRKFGKNDFYAFPSREGYTALVTEIEYLRDKVAEFQPQSTTDEDVKKLLEEHYAPTPDELEASAKQEALQLQQSNAHNNGTTETAAT